MSSRPQRKRKATEKAGTIRWTEETLKLLRADSDSPDDSSHNALAETGAEDEDDQDFEAVPGETAADEKDLEDHSAGDESSSVATHSEDEDGGRRKRKKSATKGRTVARNSYVTPTPQPAKDKRVSTLSQNVRNIGKKKVTVKPEGVRSVGITVGFERLKGGKQTVYQHTYGSTLQDLYPALKARDLWHRNLRDVTLPSRKTLKNCLQERGRDGFPFQNGSLCQEDETLFEKTMGSNQMAKDISAEEALRFNYLPRPQSHKIVHGRPNEKQKTSLDYLKSTNMAGSWSKKRKVNENESMSLDERASVHTHPAPSEEMQGDPLACENGWLLNLGSRISYIAWAPCSSNKQYCAITTSPTDAQRDCTFPTEHVRAQAFSPNAPHPSNIQIWQIEPVPELDPFTSCRMSTKIAPRLAQILCLDWGGIRRMEWRPLTAKSQDSTAQLAILTTDGAVRILNIDLTSATDQPSYIHLQQPHMAFYPTLNTVFTALCYASPSDLILGTANGSISLYNLHHSSLDMHPYLTLPLITTYISGLAIATDLPHLVCITAAGGDLHLTDLRSPSVDRLTLHKSRLPTSNVAYMPFNRTFVTTTDSSGNSETYGTTVSTLIAHNIRHFSFGNVVLKMPEAQGICTVMATSKFHPCVLVANSAGSVLATNYLRRTLPCAFKGPEGTGYAQKLFDHHWQEDKEAPIISSRDGESAKNTDSADVLASYPSKDVTPDNHNHNHDLADTEVDADAEAEPDLEHSPVQAQAPNTSAQRLSFFHPPDTRPGLSRLTAGFKPEKIILGGPSDNKKSKGDLATTQIIFEEEQACTAMAWNGNAGMFTEGGGDDSGGNERFAAWAAIGWASGIVWLGDLGHDME